MKRRRVFSLLIGVALLAGGLAFSSAPAAAQAPTTMQVGQLPNAAGPPSPDCPCSQPCRSAPVQTSYVAISPGGSYQLAFLLQDHAGGYFPNCTHWYSQQVATYSPLAGDVMNYGDFHLRIWVCGVYKGDFGVTNGSRRWYSNAKPVYNSPSFAYDGTTCNPQADNYLQSADYDGYFWQVPYNGGGYVHY